MHINRVSRGSEEFLFLYHEHGASHKVVVPTNVRTVLDRSLKRTLRIKLQIERKAVSSFAPQCSCSFCRNNEALCGESRRGGYQPPILFIRPRDNRLLSIP